MVVAAAGIDTWSPSWYLDPESTAGRRFAELATVRSAAGSSLLPEPIAGHRVGWFGGQGLVFAEGHPAALHGAEGLACPDDLPALLGLLEERLLSAEVPLDTRERPLDYLGPTSTGRAGVRRLDATMDLRFETTAAGMAVLAGVAAVLRDAPGKCDVIYGRDRGVETVYLMAERRRLARWYDKGVESRSAPRGQLVRPEDQRRWAKDSRRDVTELSAAYVRSKFHARFGALWRASKGVTVAGPIVLADKLARAVEAGELSLAAARALAGHMLLEPAGVTVPARTTRYYRRRARELGLVVADGVLQEVEIDLGDVMEELLDTDAWEAAR